MLNILCWLSLSLSLSFSPSSACFDVTLALEPQFVCDSGSEQQAFLLSEFPETALVPDRRGVVASSYCDSLNSLLIASDVH